MYEYQNKKAQLSTAGQMWVDYHMNAVRQLFGMTEQAQIIAADIAADHLEETTEPIYAVEADGEISDEDPVPVKTGKKKPSATTGADRPRARRFIQRG